ncbi:MAG: Hsp20/alpha crystallin family protein [Candidatus Krumholzibacteriota bacterium]|nr:Hsp20/alpha crystallin family protein [Candidatus Krumholzibacteriota bacterium]
MKKRPEFIDGFGAGREGRRRVKLPADLAWEPAVDICESADEVILSFEIAGMDPERISVEVDGRILRIDGFRENACPAGELHFHTLEIRMGRFRREIALPVSVDPSKTNARYRNGMLEIRIRKLDSNERVRNVPVE